ncbi:MAG TPA: MBL fold metallo-hydrolase [Terriglobales bacterium]|jgi:beta-lactamase superfamily II metal-dependent hydrolase
MRGCPQVVFTISLFLLLLVPLAKAKSSKSMHIYSIDVEGGQSTLIVSPSGQTLLIDAGWPGKIGADRVLALTKQLGIKKLNYVLITHFHHDHVGGIPDLVKQIKVGTFIDHGQNREDSDITRKDYAAYEGAIAGTKHIVAKPGDRIHIKGLNVVVLTADGGHISHALSGAGQENPFCAGEPNWLVDRSENAYSLGTLTTFGKFRFLDLGDLTKKKESELMCPDNPIGSVDLFLVSHHGLDQSNSKALVDAIHPRVAIMNNGARKGASPEAWQRVYDAPGLIALWQLHYAEAGGKEHNVADDFIANTKTSSDGNYIEVTAHPDGRFTVENSRNQFEKTYAP